MAGLSRISFPLTVQLSPREGESSSEPRAKGSSRRSHQQVPTSKTLQPLITTRPRWPHNRPPLPSCPFTSLSLFVRPSEYSQSNPYARAEQSVCLLPESGTDRLLFPGFLSPTLTHSTDSCSETLLANRAREATPGLSHEIEP